MTSIADEITEDYVRHMESLMKKHGLDRPEKDLDLKPIVNGIKQNSTNVKSASNNKGVRFAEELDIANVSSQSNLKQKDASVVKIEPEPSPISAIIVEKPSQTVNPVAKSNIISSDIIERASVQRPYSEHVEQPKKVSRFKAARQAKSQPSQVTTAASTTELGLKNEFSLYRDRMRAPLHEIDRSLYKEADGEAEPVYTLEKPKMSRFKADRLGYQAADSEED